MCDATLAIAGIGAAASLAGTAYSAQQSKKASNAISAQNSATQLAQAKAFDQRIQTQRTQTSGDLNSYIQQIQDQSTAGDQMRTAQSKARQDQADILKAENTQQEAARQQADTQAQSLLDQTSGQNLQASQANAQTNQQALLDASLNQSGTQGPDATDPSGGDSTSQSAMTRRMAQAATNVRDYGQKIAETTSYGQPLQDVGQAILANQQGIMPAAQASKLLQGGAAVRLLPSQMAYQGASSVGSAMDQVIASRGQGQRTVNSLATGDNIALANLQQSDTDTIAANKAAQAKQDAAYGQSVGNIISGIGNLGLYGAGYYGGDQTGLGAKLQGMFKPTATVT